MALFAEKIYFDGQQTCELLHVLRVHPVISAMIGKYIIAPDTEEVRKHIKSLNISDCNSGSVPRFEILNP